MGAAVRNADFIQENGPERLDVKHSLIASIESAARADAIIASSSSGLAISEIQAGAKHPERIVLGHPFNPSHIIPLVEVGGGSLTSPENIARTMAFYSSTGKKVIRINKEVKGHIANRLQVAIWQEAISLVQRGVASRDRRLHRVDCERRRYGTAVVRFSRNASPARSIADSTTGGEAKSFSDSVGERYLKLSRVWTQVWGRSGTR